MNKATKKYLTLFAILIVIVFVGTVVFVNKERFASPPPLQNMTPPQNTTFVVAQQVLPYDFVQPVLQLPQVPQALKQQLQDLQNVPAQSRQQATLSILYQILSIPGIPIQIAQQATQLQQQILQQLQQQSMQQNPQQNAQGRCGPSFQNQKCPATQCCSDTGFCGGKKGTASDSCKYDVPIKGGFFGGAFDG